MQGHAKLDSTQDENAIGELSANIVHYAETPHNMRSSTHTAISTNMQVQDSAPLLLEGWLTPAFFILGIHVMSRLLAQFRDEG